MIKIRILQITTQLLPLIIIGACGADEEFEAARAIERIGGVLGCDENTPGIVQGKPVKWADLSLHEADPRTSLPSGS